MLWKVESMSGLRCERAELALSEGANMSDLCRRFPVSRKTGYKWLGRYATGGTCGLSDRSRKPNASLS